MTIVVMKLLWEQSDFSLSLSLSLVLGSLSSTVDPRRRRRRTWRFSFLFFSLSAQHFNLTQRRRIFAWRCRTKSKQLTPELMATLFIVAPYPLHSLRFRGNITRRIKSRFSSTWKTHARIFSDYTDVGIYLIPLLRFQQASLLLTFFGFYSFSLSLSLCRWFYLVRLSNLSSKLSWKDKNNRNRNTHEKGQAT